MKYGKWFFLLSYNQVDYQVNNWKPRPKEAGLLDPDHTDKHRWGTADTSCHCSGPVTGMVFLANPTTEGEMLSPDLSSPSGKWYLYFSNLHFHSYHCQIAVKTNCSVNLCLIPCNSFYKTHLEHSLWVRNCTRHKWQWQAGQINLFPQRGFHHVTNFFLDFKTL